MTATTKQGRGWCELSECGDRIRPQDVTIIINEDGNEVSVCNPCLVGLGDEVSADDLAAEEAKTEVIDRELEKTLEKVETLQREIDEGLSRESDLEQRLRERSD